MQSSLRLILFHTVLTRVASLRHSQRTIESSSTVKHIHHVQLCASTRRAPLHPTLHTNGRGRTQSPRGRSRGPRGNHADIRVKRRATPRATPERTSNPPIKSNHL